ncbi:MAG: metallophosphoesterase [Kofleriaceae bacterium]
MRATWLTDIHLNFLRPLALRAFYDRIKAEQPQVLLVTGDIGESDSVVRFVGELGELAPIYFVLGNHDYYRSSIAAVRGAMERLESETATWLPAHAPMRISQHTVMLGIDGWGDARCGDLDSTVQLSDWKLIDDFKKAKDDRNARVDICKRLGGNEARALRDKLSTTSEAKQLLILTHVPPFPEACVYGGEISTAPWLPWFTCISTGEVLLQHAQAHPETQMLVLCGHSHGAGSFHPAPNLEIRTGGWPAGVQDYGNPIIQQTIEV